MEWQPGTKECQGSGGMVNCINEAPGTIGYLDAGHGHLEGFDEIHLENSEGTKLTSTMAMQRGGVAAAAEVPNLLPTSSDKDFSAVDLINKVHLHHSCCCLFQLMCLNHFANLICALFYVGACDL